MDMKMDAITAHDINALDELLEELLEGYDAPEIIIDSDNITIDTALTEISEYQGVWYDYTEIFWNRRSPMGQMGLKLEKGPKHVAIEALLPNQSTGRLLYIPWTDFHNMDELEDFVLAFIMS